MTDRKASATVNADSLAGMTDRKVSVESLRNDNKVWLGQAGLVGVVRDGCVDFEGEGEGFAGCPRGDAGWGAVPDGVKEVG